MLAVPMARRATRNGFLVRLGMTPHVSVIPSGGATGVEEFVRLTPDF